MQRLCANEGPVVKLPQNVHDLAKRIRRITYQKRGETGTVPTCEELAEDLNVSSEQVKLVMQVRNHPPLFLHQSVGSGMSFVDSGAPTEVCVQGHFGLFVLRFFCRPFS
jgi:DNA-directed RNA polymerase sigma subunit (sigma70/sigma32)